MGSHENGVVFEDYFPAMVEKLGAEGFMNELSNGFWLLADSEKGVITLESLKRNWSMMGLEEMENEELMSMLREGDIDGDGALNQFEFFTLMFRLSPALLDCSAQWLLRVLIDNNYL